MTENEVSLRKRACPEGFHDLMPTCADDFLLSVPKKRRIKISESTTFSEEDEDESAALTLPATPTIESIKLKGEPEFLLLPPSRYSKEVNCQAVGLEEEALSQCLSFLLESDCEDESPPPLQISMHQQISTFQNELTTPEKVEAASATFNSQQNNSKSSCKNSNSSVISTIFSSKKQRLSQNNSSADLSILNYLLKNSAKKNNC